MSNATVPYSLINDTRKTFEMNFLA